MNHTPGPWAVWTFDEDSRHLYVGPQAGGLAIADVVACNAHGCYTAETEDRGRANAQLIAAAPDLLAALKAADKWVAMYHTLPGHEAASECMSRVIRAAIAKATGESV